MTDETKSSLKIAGSVAIIILLLIIGLLLTGCSLFRDDKPTFRYPDEIKTLCIQARADAKACIGDEADFKYLTVYKVAGQKRFGRQWAIQDPVSGSGRWGTGWFASRLNGYQEIWIPCDPATGEISYSALVHEMGHSILNKSGHDPAHSHCFERW